MVKDIQEIQFADQPGRREVIRGKFTCASTNVVYLLTCTACQAAYVGETGCTLRERMNGHRSAIKNGEDTPVADHFKEEHSARVSVLTSTIAIVPARFTKITLLETWYMWRRRAESLGLLYGTTGRLRLKMHEIHRVNLVRLNLLKINHAK